MVYRFAQTVTYFIGDSSQTRNDKFFQLETRNFQLRNYHLANDSLKTSCVIRSKITSKAAVNCEPTNCSLASKS